LLEQLRKTLGEDTRGTKMDTRGEGESAAKAKRSIKIKPAF
jgi:hypothetical protein